MPYIHKRQTFLCSLHKIATTTARYASCASYFYHRIHRACTTNSKALPNILSTRQQRNVPTILQYNPLYIGLTWNDTNRLAGGAFGQGGLTPWGEQVVKQIEQTSLVDTAHLNEKSFYAFANITQKPILCSHTALASFYKHPRNLTNAQIQTIVQSNGLVGLCFVSEFINGKKHCTVQDIAQEIDYFVEHFGINHIALGTDFYGTKKLPVGIKTYEDIFLLYTKLQNRGYTQKQIEQLFFQNAQTFFANVYKSYK